MYLKIILLTIIFFIFFKLNIFGCHKGGPMGFATNDPGGFSLDITLSPTYTGASTLGTLNCKNWDYAQHQKNQFLKSQWDYLNEEASRGTGKNLLALSRLIGCAEKKHSAFSSLLHENFNLLFAHSMPTPDFFEKLNIIISKNPSHFCQG